MIMTSLLESEAILPGLAGDAVLIAPDLGQIP
jgi:hypothetical protein